MSGIYQPPFLEESSAESSRNTSYLNFTLEFPNGERLNSYGDRYSPLALELTRLLSVSYTHLRVTVMGRTFTLLPPFFVLATQNPIEQEGTYPLPEAQLDRFLRCV